MSKIVGIDLGTSNSCCAVMEGGKPTIIVNSEGSDTTPSVVAFKKDGTRLVGVTAKRQSVTNGENTIYSSKRFIGHSFSEVKEEKVPYKVKKTSNNGVAFHIPVIDKDLTPQEIGAAILSKIKADAEAYLGEPVTKAVITVPAYFNNDQKEQTKIAGEIAGLEVVRIINEPTAAALAYGVKTESDSKIFVFDLGGGTFDVSVIESSEGLVEVLASNGDSHLGGDDFDNKIIEWVISENKKSTGIDLSKDNSALQRIKEASEKAKIELSNQLSTNINLPYLTSVDNQPVHLDMELTRAKFESMVQPLLERIKKPVIDVLKDSVDKSHINEVLLVGGSSRIPCVQQLIKELIGIEPSRGINPDLAVAFGAAVQGGILAGDVKDIVLIDVAPLSLGVECNGGIVQVLIPKNTAIPASRKETFTTAIANQTEVTINIIQGERTLAKDNKSLGSFNLSGIAPAPARVPQIEVSFNIDANGILSVSAKDIGTGKEQTITITQSANLSKEEIERMIQDSEDFAEADKEVKEFILLKNDTESLCANLETTLDASKDKVDQGLIDNVRVALDKTKDALRTGSKEELEALRKELLEESNKLSAELYKNVEQNPDMIDAEVVEG